MYEPEKKPELKIKLSYIIGLKQVVLKELQNSNFGISTTSQVGSTSEYIESEDTIYTNFSSELLSKTKKLRSVSRAYLVSQSWKYNPAYLDNHKSVIGNLIEIILTTENLKTTKNKSKFKTFKISCAGSKSAEVRSIAEYIQDTYGLTERTEADLKIHIIKIQTDPTINSEKNSTKNSTENSTKNSVDSLKKNPKDIWEVGVQLTPKPLSVRDYRVANLSGAMDSTIAYAVNSFCNLNVAKSYLNTFSGSGTLLIEAGQGYPNITRLLGFDISKIHLSLAIQNIKKAGLIERVAVKEADIFNQPDFGKFDAIVADLPFGMTISKDEDLEKLYTAFIEYSQKTLNVDGRLVIYTSQYKLIEEILSKSNFKIIKNLQLKFLSNVQAYLRPKIIVCKLR